MEDSITVGYMDYRNSNINVKQLKPNVFTVSLRFSFYECIEEPSGVNKKVVSEKWCSKWHPFDITEQFESLGDITNARWSSPNVLEFTFVPSTEMYEKDLTEDEVVEEFETYDLEDGAYECIDTDDYFWSVPASFLVECI